jgi:PAS domain S-box-containing protein
MGDLLSEIFDLAGVEALALSLNLLHRPRFQLHYPAEQDAAGGLLGKPWNVAVHAELEGSAMAIGRLMMYRQLFFTLVLLALFWILYGRLYKREPFRWFGLAWTSFAAYLTGTALILQFAAEWTLLKSSLILFSVLAGFLQVPLLVFAAWSLRSEEQRLRRWLKPGIAVALIAGALSFAASFIYRDQPVLSVSLRSVLRTLALVGALSFYAFALWQRWQRNRRSGATALAGIACVLAALDQVVYSAGYIRGLILGQGAVLGPSSLPLLRRAGAALLQSPDLPMLVLPPVLLLDAISSVGIALGLVLLLMEEHHQVESSVRETANRTKGMEEANAALLAEINERKRMEQALEENEDRYRDLVEHSEDLLCTHDLNGRLLSVNPAAARVLGYSVEELLQIPMREIVVPRFRARFDAYIERIQKSGDASGLMAVRTRTGEERIWEYHNTLRTEGVASPIVRGMAHDVTEKMQAERLLRQSEAKFATAFRSSPSAMMISALADGEFIDVNEAFERQTGYTRTDVVGLTAVQLGMWVDTTQWERLASELQDGTAVKGSEMQLRTKSNGVLTVSYSAESIELTGRRCVLAVAEDVTARKHVEEKLRDLSSHLVRAQEEERARIARELHDDVSQRLTVLAMKLYELKNSSPNSDSSQIEKIDALAKLTSEISTDVRRVSHRLHPAVLDLVGLVAAMSESCREFARLSNMDIEFVHRQVPRTLPKDVTLCLYRVAQEAIRNAQKHSGSRQVQVELMGASDSVRLRVSDSGVGFDVQSVDRDRLGLVSMAERLRSLGGELTVHSQPGRGTSIEAHVVLAAHPNQDEKNLKQQSAG